MLFFRSRGARFMALSFTIAVVATLAFVLAKPAHARRSWCEPIKVFMPPSHFNPLAASRSQLRANGLPLRPPKSDHPAYMLWKSVISHAKHFEVPHPVCSKTKRATIYTGSWAGHVVPRNDYGGNYITATESEWVQPAVNGDPNYTNYNSAPDSSFWGRNRNFKHYPEFANVLVWDNYFWQNDGSNHRLDSAENDKYIISSNCTSGGTILSDPGSVSDTDGSFAHYWDARQPYSNTCS